VSSTELDPAAARESRPPALSSGCAADAGVSATAGGRRVQLEEPGRKRGVHAGGPPRSLGRAVSRRRSSVDWMPGIPCAAVPGRAAALGVPPRSRALPATARGARFFFGEPSGSTPPGGFSRSCTALPTSDRLFRRARPGPPSKHRGAGANGAYVQRRRVRTRRSRSPRTTRARRVARGRQTSRSAVPMPPSCTTSTMAVAGTLTYRGNLLNVLDMSGDDHDLRRVAARAPRWCSPEALGLRAAAVGRRSASRSSTTSAARYGIALP